MNFQSLHFLIFATTVFALNALLLPRPAARKYMLLLASYYFYMCWDWRFAGMLLVVAGANYLGALKIQQSRSGAARRVWLALALLVCLGVLAFFKYANFFLDSARQLIEAMGLHADIPTLSILLPIGISFFTFQGISYTIDVYRKQQEATRNFTDVALFVAFFPTVLSGPITRGRQLLPQIASPSAYSSERAQEGIFLILRGLSKKVFLADIIAMHIVVPAFDRPHEFTSAFLALAVVAYSFQIYMDLSGYTDIARGLAKALGFELPENFNSPYRAHSVSNFWQRWHMSMSGFFRDYLYFGVGGSKHGNVYLNLLITFVAIGLWHGAGWNFVVYGLMHGCVVCAERYFRSHQVRLGIADVVRHTYWIWGACIATFLFVAFSRILFRSADLGAAITYVGAMAGAGGLAPQTAPYTFVGLLALGSSVALHFVPARWNQMMLDGFVRAPASIQAVTAVVLVLGMLAATSGPATFVYFQF